MIVDSHALIMGMLGGLLLGCSAALLLLGNGRIAGISGIAGRLVSARPGDTTEQRAFIAGLIIAPVAYAAVAGVPEIGVTRDPVLLIAGGLIVGFGTALGSGCTSGHGVCGVTRLSARSIVATLTFMAIGIVTASSLQPVLRF